MLHVQQTIILLMQREENPTKLTITCDRIGDGATCQLVCALRYSVLSGYNSSLVPLQGCTSDQQSFGARRMQLSETQK